MECGDSSQTIRADSADTKVVNRVLTDSTVRALIAIVDAGGVHHL
jgi:hypothetical protein